MRQYYVVIPVYNAFDTAVECVRSVINSTQPGVDIIVIDDASTDGDFKEYCRTALGDRTALINFYRSEENKGYGGSCNKGISIHPDRDVILLNSDTVVTRNWDLKLKNAAYSRQGIGTVTPLTNNGTICSVPNFCVANKIPEGLSIEQFACIVEECAVPEYPSIPTCVGHCIYLKRDMLNKVGVFDTKLFPRGYGEENDLSMRAQKAGFIDILDDATFIYHRGETSFSSEAQSLREKATAVINRLYPHYAAKVAKFCRKDPLLQIRNRILDRLIANKLKKSKTILHIVHNGPFVERRGVLGGTEMLVRQIIEDNHSMGFHWSLVPGKGCYILTAHLDDCHREFYIKLDTVSLKRIISDKFFSLVHLHHSRYMDHKEVCDALSEHKNYLISFHDYVLVCPRFFFLTPTRKVCNGFECSVECALSPSYISEYRSASYRLIKNAKKLIVFSESSVQWLKKFFPDINNWTIIPHGVPYDIDRTKLHFVQRKRDKLKVLFLGNIPQHKGSLIIERLLTYKSLNDNTPIEWLVLGALFSEVRDGYTDLGSYRREEVQRKLIEADPDLVCILSICPETYCMTLDEAWSAGIPALVTPYGAPAERVKRYGAGWVLKSLNPEEIYRTLNQIWSNPKDYEDKKRRAVEIKLTSTREESERYAEVYKDFLIDSPTIDRVTMLNFIRKVSCDRQPYSTLSAKIVKACVNSGLVMLTRLGMRATVERFVYRHVPRNIIQVIKLMK